MKICVFCSANENLDPDFVAKTEELGQWIGKNGHTLVFGGTDMGLMRTVAEAAKAEGARVIGVVPRKVEERGRESRSMDVHIPCDSLTDRKELMMNQSDVFIALPGGIGTLDEIFTVAASATIGYHSKPMIVYDMKGFWHGLASMMDGLEKSGVIRGDWRECITIVNSLDEIERTLQIFSSFP